MPDTKVSALTDGTTANSTDRIPVARDAGGGTFNNRYVTPGYIGTTLLGSGTALTGSTVTTSSPVLNLTQTWNDGNVTFTGLLFNAAGASGTNSAAGSLLLDLQVGGTSKASITKAGAFYGAPQAYNTALFGTSSTVGWSFLSSNYTGYYVSNGSVGISVSSVETMLKSTAALSWSSGEPGANGSDTILRRAAAATLQLGAADAAGSAIAISSVASNQLTLASNHGLSNGAAIIITGTAEPSGTSLNTLYYARSISAAVIELYDTYQNAITTSGTTGRVSVTTAGTSASVRLSTPFQTFQPQSFTGTDTPGQPFIIKGSRGTGTGAGGSIIFQVAPAGSSGTAQNAYATALTLNSAQQAVIQSAGTAALPSLTWSNDTSTGFYKSNPTILGLSIGGTGSFLWSANGFFFTASAGRMVASSAGAFSFSSGTAGTNTEDVFLYRDAANTLALKNSTNPQIFRAYSTTTGPSYGYFASGVTDAGVATADTLFIGTGGAGAAMTKLALMVNGTTQLDYASTTASAWSSFSNWNIRPASGASSTTYWYAGSAYVVLGCSGGTDSLINGSAFGDTCIRSNAKNILLSADTGTTYALRINSSNLLQFQGTTSSFPALKRSSASLICRLADDTANAAFESASVKTDAPSGGTSGTWKLGVRVAATTTLDTTQYIEVDVGGTLYKLAVVTS